MRATAPVRVASSADPWGKKERHWGYRQDGGARCVKDDGCGAVLSFGVETRTRFLVLARYALPVRTRLLGGTNRPAPGVKKTPVGNT